MSQKEVRGGGGVKKISGSHNLTRDAVGGNSNRDGTVTAAGGPGPEGPVNAQGQTATRTTLTTRPL